MKYDTTNHRDKLIVRERSSGYPAQTGMKRLTIDIPADLHSAIKVDCARKGTNMADVIRGILRNEFEEGE